MLSVILSCLLVMSAHAQKNTIVKLSYCDYACAAGENCVDTGIRCVRAPCPTYQCRGVAAMQQDSAHNIYERLAFLIAKLRGPPPPLSEIPSRSNNLQHNLSHNQQDNSNYKTLYQIDTRYFLHQDLAMFGWSQTLIAVISHAPLVKNV